MELIKRPANYRYQELNTPISTKFDYPNLCPVCNSEAKENKDFYENQGYECGGGWNWKSQIQNHTDYVYGTCGLNEPYAEQERVVTLAIFYMSFSNWSMFHGLEGVESEKEHVLYKMTHNWSAPNDYREKYRKWVDENFDEQIERIKSWNEYGRYVDPRLICGFDEDDNPIYETDWEEISRRLNEIGFNEYGSLQFYRSGSMDKSLTTWWKRSAVESV